jgi:arylsulfatase A-like enzyme
MRTASTTFEFPARTIPGRRAWLAPLALFAVLAACGRGEERAHNVILISIDTLRPDHLGCYGYDRDTSPSIDALAKGGVLFEDVTAASPWTLPSHATMFTGMYPSRHGVKDHVNRLSDEIPTLATRLGRRGFRTMAVVNSHNLSERFGLDQGFEEFLYVDEFSAPDDPERRIVNRGEEITDQGFAWLDEDDDRPFFLFLHYYDVHTDFDPEERYREQFVGPYEGKIDGTTGQLVAARRNRAVLSEADITHLRDLYDAEIRQMDDLIARLVDYLDETGLQEDTLLVITSDHGEEYQEHGSLLHGRTFFQEVIAIPLVLSGPGVATGVRIAEPVHLIDVTPTILDLLEVPLRGEDDGIPLADYWRSPETAPRGRFLFAEADHNNEEPDMGRVVRIEGHKLTFDRFTKKTELFDLRTDPEERHDLSETDAERLEALMERIESFMESERTGEQIDPPTAAEMENLEKLGYTR